MAQDGVIKFQLKHTAAAALPWDQLAELNAWRKILVMLEMIGQTPKRYDNIGFGNISTRIGDGNTEGNDAVPFKRCFAITGTQTGGVEQLCAEHFVSVTECLPAQNTACSRAVKKLEGVPLPHARGSFVDTEHIGSGATEPVSAIYVSLVSVRCTQRACAIVSFSPKSEPMP